MITLAEFAKEIGVSTATVSSVFNNRSKERRISEKTEALIRSQAEKYGYQPNIAARRLRTQRDMQVCELAVLTAYESPSAVSANIVKALEKTSKRRYPNITPLIETVMFHRNHIQELPGILDGNRYNGAVITNTGIEDDIFFQNNKITYPLVFLGRDIPGYYCVDEDPRHIGQEAATELVKTCKSRHPAVLTLCDDLLTQTTKLRTEGFMDRCAELGVEATLIQADGISARAGRKVAVKHLKTKPLDGLFCVSDHLAVGAYFSIKENGLSIPKDVAVVGIGDLDLCKYIDPPLTVFRRMENERQKDEYAAEILLNRLFERDTHSTSRIFQTSLLRRESSSR